MRWWRGDPRGVPQPGARLHHLLARLGMVAGVGGARPPEGQSEIGPLLHRLLARDIGRRHGDGLHANDWQYAGGAAARRGRIAAQLLVEPVTKWATQAGDVHTLYEHVVRAGEFAQRTPMGPVYLNAPLEVMLQEWTPRQNPRRAPPPPKTRAKDSDVEKVAQLLIGARNPVILTDSAGRDPAAFAALVELADLFGIPVGAPRSRTTRRTIRCISAPASSRS